MAIFDDVSGKTNNPKIISKLLSLAVQNHIKMDIKFEDTSRSGILNSFEDGQFVVFMKNNIKPGKEGEANLFFSGYLLHFKVPFEPIERNFCSFKLPKKLHYKRRDFRLKFPVSGIDPKYLEVFADIETRGKFICQARIGSLLDISKSGIGLKPLPDFLDHEWKIGETLSNVYFKLKGSNIIVEESKIRTINSKLAGLEFTGYSSKYKKIINDFILSFLKAKNEEEKKHFFLTNFPSRYKKKEREAPKKLFRQYAEENEKVSEEKLDLKDIKVLIFDLNTDIYSELFNTYNVMFAKNPDKARLNLIRNKPDIIISTVYYARNPYERLKWFNLINEAKTKKIPIILKVDGMIEKEKLVKAIKMFGVCEVILAGKLEDSSIIMEKVNKVVKKKYCLQDDDNPSPESPAN